MFVKYIHLFFGFSLLSVGFFTNADTANPGITIGVNEWPPYTISSIETDGLVKELLAEVFQKQGIDTEWNVMPWNRVKTQVKNLSIDGTIAWYTEERARDFLYSEPILENSLIILKRKGMEVHWENVTDLQNYTFALLRGSVVSNEFDTSDLIKKFFVPKQELAIKMVAHKRVDMAILDELMVEYLLYTSLKKYESVVESVPRPLTVKPLHFIVSKSHPRGEELIDAFNIGMRKLKEKGIYNALLKSYGLLKKLK